MSEAVLHAVVRLRATLSSLRLHADERGEGVISAAIAVLIMAFLGAGMWLAFNTLFQDAAAKTSTQINCIGGSGC